MKKKYFFLFFLFFLIPFFVQASESTTIYLFYSKTCPHCQAEKEYLNTLKDERNITIKELEVTENQKNAEWMSLVKESLNDNHNYVPYTVIGSTSITGFNDSTTQKIESAVDQCEQEGCEDICAKVKETGKAIVSQNQENDEKKKVSDNDSKYKLPILGEIDARNISLPLVAIVIGLVDGFNPCAMWILIFLISMLLGMKERKKMWLIGFTFLITSALVYLLFMGAWLKISLNISQIMWVRILIGIVALIGAYINLKNYWKTRKEEAGCHIVDEKKRKKTIEKIKKITNQKSIFLAIIGVIVLAISVNFVELACSAGLPLLFTQILAFNDLSIFQYSLYMGIYILCYLLDDILVFVIAMITLKITGITNKYSKYSHLIGGFIMLLIGLLMIFKPEILMMNW